LTDLWLGGGGMVYYSRASQVAPCKHRPPIQRFWFCSGVAKLKKRPVRFDSAIACIIGKETHTVLQMFKFRKSQFRKFAEKFVTFADFLQMQKVCDAWTNSFLLFAEICGLAHKKFVNLR
jgi:hypothetical protein